MIVIPPRLPLAEHCYGLARSRSLLLVVIVFWHVVVLVSEVVPGTFQEAFVLVRFGGRRSVSGY